MKITTRSVQLLPTRYEGEGEELDRARGQDRGVHARALPVHLSPDRSRWQVVVAGCELKELFI